MVGGEDPEFERELIADFLDGLPGVLAAMESAADAADAETLRRSAHTLKSHAAVFGASRLEAECRALEAAAADGVPPHDLVSVVVAEAKRVQAAMSELG
jgi:HPt (histidine-containing phosphotransfer) domain-containing protein